MSRVRVGLYFVLTVLFFLPTLVSDAAPDEAVIAYGDEFYLNGQSYRFVGVNMRGLCHYGYGDILPYTTSGHIDENLAAVAAMGGKVIRVFAPVKFATHQQDADRLEIVLDKMESLGLKALVSLTDLYHTGFHPQGDDSYYQAQSSGWTLLDDTWFAGGYQNNYLPMVQLVVNQLKDHNAIFAWELGNELTDIKNPNNIIGFTTSAAAAIKAIDPHHMVTTGFISIDHTQIGETAGYNLYADPNLDFISAHTYNGDDPFQNHAVYSRLAKPLIVGEYGWTDGTSVDRPARTQEQMEKWFDQYAARGFLQWGFQAQAWDIGDGDNVVGMDRYAHDDYNALHSVYSTRATQLAGTTHPLPERLTPKGVNVALESTEWKADSTYDAANGGDNAYDGILTAGSKWTSNGNPPPHWLALDLGRVRRIDGFSLRMAGIAGERFDFAFKNYKIESGNSIDGPWITEFEVNNSPQFSNVHSIYETPKPIRYVRIYITNSGIDNYCRLPELEVYEALATGTGGWYHYY